MDTHDAEHRRLRSARLAAIGMSVEFRLLMAELVAKASAPDEVVVEMILPHHIEILAAL